MVKRKDRPVANRLAGRLSCAEHDADLGFILHDRDAILSTGCDASLARLGLAVIETPVRSPKANSLLRKAHRDPPA